jgi:hypothetical protein
MWFACDGRSYSSYYEKNELEEIRKSKVNREAI